MAEIQTCSSRVVLEQRFCGLCERKEHPETKDGKCHFCWGSGVRITEGVHREPCIFCVCVYPEPKAFCIHRKWHHECKICQAEQREFMKDILTMDMTKFALFVARTQRRRLDD